MSTSSHSITAKSLVSTLHVSAAWKHSLFFTWYTNYSALGFNIVTTMDKCALKLKIFILKKKKVPCLVEMHMQTKGKSKHKNWPTFHLKDLWLTNTFKIFAVILHDYTISNSTLNRKIHLLSMTAYHIQPKSLCLTVNHFTQMHLQIHSSHQYSSPQQDSTKTWVTALGAKAEASCTSFEIVSSTAFEILFKMIWEPLPLIRNGTLKRLKVTFPKIR